MKTLRTAMLGCLVLLGCQAVEDARLGHVRAKMKDPASAIFQNVHAGTLPGILCGEVNARNGFGGYTGFVYFYADDKGGAGVSSVLANQNRPAYGFC
jgi:hypothetical protein